MGSRVSHNQSHQTGLVSVCCSRSRGLSCEEHFTAPAITGTKFVADIAAAGTVAAIAVAGGVYRCRDSGAAGDNHAGVNQGGIQTVSQAGHAILEARVAVATTAANTRCWAVMHNAGAFLAVGNWIGFTHSAPVNANWRCMSTVGGGAINDVNSLVPVVLGQYYRLMVELIPRRRRRLLHRRCPGRRLPRRQCAGGGARAPRLRRRQRLRRCRQPRPQCRRAECLHERGLSLTAS